MVRQATGHFPMRKKKSVKPTLPSKVVIVDAPLRTLCEIGQPCEIRFAFANLDGDKAKCTHTWIKCRDFLVDAVVCRHFDWRGTGCVYGFSYDKTTATNSIAVKNQNEVAIDEINKFIPGSVYIPCDSSSGLYVLSPEWTSNPTMVSLVTAIIRIKQNHNLRSEDVAIRDALKPSLIESALACTDKLKAKLKKDTPISTVHNYSGAYSLIKDCLWFK